MGLTSGEPGADKGEPDKYYPTGERHYLRIVPKDTIQGAALATVMKQDSCSSTYILNDKEVYGAGLAKNIESSAKEQGLEVPANEGIDPKAPNFRSQAQTIKSSGADCFVFAGVTPNGAVQLFKDVAAALPDAKLYGPDGVSNPEFFVADEGGIPADVAERVKVTVATLSPDQYPPRGSASSTSTRSATTSRASTRTRSTAMRRCSSCSTHAQSSAQTAATASR